MSQMITLIRRDTNDPDGLLMHFDGANGSTTFSDDSGFGHTFTRVGTPIISTAQSKFGGSSFYGNGSSYLLATESSRGFFFGKRDFTVDLWYQFAEAPSSFKLIFDCRASGFQAAAFRIEYSSGWQTGYGGTLVVGTSTLANVGEWQHIAVTRKDGCWRLFVNGTIVGSANNTEFLYNTAARPAINTQGDNPGGSGTPTAYIDELRVINGIARWTSDFTPYSNAYVTYLD